jgi:Rrf2 family protein
MLFTKRVDYSIRAILYLSTKQQGKPIYLREVSEARGISRNFLAKIFPDLMRGGLVKSYRGSRGGFILAKDPAEITIADIIKSVRGPIAISKCLQQNQQCEYESSCKVQDLWKKAQEHLMGILNKTTIADLKDDAFS